MSKYLTSHIIHYEAETIIKFSTRGPKIEHYNSQMPRNYESKTCHVPLGRSMDACTFSIKLLSAICHKMLAKDALGSDA